MIDLRSLQRALGGEISGGQLLCPGPGHSPRDRSLSVRPIGKHFVVFSHSGDGWTQCKDFRAAAGSGCQRGNRVMVTTGTSIAYGSRPSSAPAAVTGRGFTPQTALIDFNPMLHKLPNRACYHTVAQHQHGASTLMPTNLWQPGVSGNPAGRVRGSRNKLSEEVILRAFARLPAARAEGCCASASDATGRLPQEILALLVPREHKVEHSNALKNLTDEQLEAMIEYIKSSLEAQAGGRVIEGTIETVEPTALPALEPPRPKNRLMLEADTAVGPSDHKRSRKVPSPSGA